MSLTQDSIVVESGAAVMTETVAEAIVQDPVSMQQPSPVTESLVVSSPLDIVPVTQDSVTMVSGAANMFVAHEAMAQDLLSVQEPAESLVVSVSLDILLKAIMPSLVAMRNAIRTLSVLPPGIHVLKLLLLWLLIYLDVRMVRSKF